MCDAMDADEVEALLKEQDAKGTKDISRNAKGKKGTLQNAKGKKGISRNAKKNTITSQKRKKGKSEMTGTKYNTFMKRRKVTSEDALGIISGPLGPTLSEDELQARLRMLSALPAIPAWNWGEPVITVGSDFTGINCIGLSLLLNGIKHQHVFMCENDPNCLKMLMYHFPGTTTFIGDIRKRDHNLLPTVDIFTTTFPCQSYSAQGPKGGSDDPRGALFEYSLAFVKAKLPNVVCMENVSNLKSQFNDVLRKIFREMSAAGYTIPAEEHVITDTLYNGNPQSRPRLVAIFIRKDTLKREFVPPARLDHVVKLSLLIPPSDRAGKLPPIKEFFRERVRQSWRVLTKKGWDPKTDVIVTDVGCSEKFNNTMVNLMPCITARRGEARAYYISTKGDKMSHKDMLMSHGMPPRFYDRDAAGVAKGQFGKQLGNGISCNVMMRWLPKALFSAGLVNGYYDYWGDTVRKLRDLNATHAVRSLRNP